MMRNVDNKWVPEVLCFDNNQSVGRANYLPPRPFLDVGVKSFMARERWRSRSEL